MAYVIGLLTGLAVAWLWPWQRLREILDEMLRDPGAPSPTEAAATGTPLVQAETGGETVAGRLATLSQAIENFANSAAHPRELAEEPQFLAAVRILKDPDMPLERVQGYALGANWVLSCAALAALCERDDRDLALDDIVAAFDNLTPWAIHFALAYFLVCDPRPAVGAALTNVKEWWSDNIFIPGLIRDHMIARERLGDPPAFDYRIEYATPAQQAAIKTLLGRVAHPMASALALNLDSTARANVDRAFLSSFGRFWTSAKGHEVLIEPESWGEALKSAEELALSRPPRPLMASGEARVGKTAFLRLLARRLEREGWSVFEASGADLMAGQLYFGQLEGRIQRTVEELAASKKLIWYIPDILQIAMSGTHQGQAASVLDQILPAISAGRLVVWTEATPAATARLLRLRPALRGTFEIVRMEEMDADEALEIGRALARALSEASGAVIEPGCVDIALTSARQYLTGFPGSGFDLLKLTARRAREGTAAPRFTPRDVITTLSQMTGVPAEILDTHGHVDLKAVRDYISARVIGQDEAVSAIVERIAMLKAGLNDPAKPIGVFLFAGPTGTGKTELAKTVAEYLFGSDERLIRLDMSEYQTPESTGKILGTGDAFLQPVDSLITQVRKQPFSVVLLDEFEKAHSNIWDLFLQVFDDGRLTDQLGQAADFRHCIIILTTNLGAASHRGPSLGFSPAKSTFGDDQILRAVGQTFRPEFQNRLDKVIVFHPLTRDLMRGILKKELAGVLERRGFADREWAVEWESSALEFLLEKGFSPEFGARPLKRAIDQWVIAPLAATIVEKRFPEGDQFVFVRSDGRSIVAEFVDPDADAPGVRPPPQPDQASRLALPSMVLAPAGSEEEVAALDRECEAVEQALAAAEWDALKAELGREMQASDFWSRPGRFETLARLALLDRVRAAADTARSLRARLVRGTERVGKSSRELVARLALQLHLVKEGIKDAYEAAPVEAAVLIEPALEKPGDGEAAAAWCRQLHEMYQAWARNRNMQLALQPWPFGDGDRDHLPLLLISGFGAFRLLEREAGLHVLELADDDGTPTRATARVRVAAAPLGDLSEIRLRLALRDAFDRVPAQNSVVRRYRGEPSPLVRDLGGGWRSGRLDAVLRGDFDLIAASRSER